MSKAGQRILRSAQKALAYAQGEESEGFVVHVPEDVDVKAIRTKLELTQDAFAQRFGFSLANVRNWEQGHRKPDGSARVLLTVIAREPDAVNRALRRGA